MNYNRPSAKKHWLLIHADNPNAVEKELLELLMRRLTERFSISARIRPASRYHSQTTRTADAETILFIGLADRHPCLTIEGLTRSTGSMPLQPESFCLEIKRPHPRSGLTNCRQIIKLTGRDERGLLSGIGKLLRLLAVHSNSLVLPKNKWQESPATAERGVYFATHFNNWYECAPLNEVLRYVEELALWGCNLIMFWFDMNWYPADFHKNPNSPGARLLGRLRAIAAKARSLGLRVGATGVVNEGYRGQVPPSLRADPSARRGGYYPETTICPSIPAGLCLIIENRRRFLDFIGPLDLFIAWPYDQGACGCQRCQEGAGWGSTFLKLSARLSRLVRGINPQAEFYVSTWLMDDRERNEVYKLCRQDTNWFQGIVSQTQRSAELKDLPSCYHRMVFPEISMFDCFFTAYGGHGANPAPRRFIPLVREATAHKCGAMLYSEGFYEDFNKIVWLTQLWNPRRPIESIAREYAAYYFGGHQTKKGMRLFFELEKTWGLKNLKATTYLQALRLRRELDTLKPNLPQLADGHERWKSLWYRARLDELLTRLGPDTPLLATARSCVESLAYDQPATALRKLRPFAKQVRTRAAGVEELFNYHWRYLQEAHLATSASLIFTPDVYLGGRDWQRLAILLGGLHHEHNLENRVSAALKAFKRWFWQNNIEIDSLFF